MKKTPLHESSRFADPLGDHIKAVTLSKQQKHKVYPAVDEVFGLNYIEFAVKGKIPESFVGSGDGIIGTEINLEQKDQELFFYTEDGRCINQLQDLDLKERVLNGWVCRCFLAYSIFKANEKSLLAGVVCFYYDPKLGSEYNSAIEVFIDNTVTRVMTGSYLSRKVTQDQFAHILQSGGKWALTKEEPWPKLGKGSVYFKRRRALLERLTAAAIKGNKGCAIAAAIFTALVVLGIGLLIFKLVF